jgi:hypothetical protein
MHHSMSARSISQNGEQAQVRLSMAQMRGGGVSARFLTGE